MLDLDLTPSELARLSDEEAGEAMADERTLTDATWPAKVGPGSSLDGRGK